MSSLSTAALALAVAVAAGLAGALAEVPSGKTADRRPEFPLAALAWAELNCGATRLSEPVTPRVQYEDFMRATAGYDAVRIEDGLKVACHRAIATAQRVADVSTPHP